MTPTIAEILEEHVTFELEVLPAAVPSQEVPWRGRTAHVLKDEATR